MCEQDALDEIPDSCSCLPASFASDANLVLVNLFILLELVGIHADAETEALEGVRIPFDERGNGANGTSACEGDGVRVNKRRFRRLPRLVHESRAAQRAGTVDAPSIPVHPSVHLER